MHLGEEEKVLHWAGMVRGKSFTLFWPAWVDFLEKGHLSNHWKEDNLQSPQVGAFPQKAILTSTGEKLSKLWKKLGCGQM